MFKMLAACCVLLLAQLIIAYRVLRHSIGGLIQEEIDVNNKSETQSTKHKNYLQSKKGNS